MKTTLEERIRAASGKAHTLGQKAIKHPVSSILSLCVLGICAATIAGFSQAPTEKNAVPATPPAAAGAAIPNTLPLARTLTSADGRTIDVTILSKSDTAIRAARADGKEVEIALDKLSDADRAFVAGLVAPPVKKYKVLLIADQDESFYLGEAGMEWVEPKHMRSVSEEGVVAPDLSNITGEDLKQYDLIWWKCPIPPADVDSFLKILKTYKGVIVRQAIQKTTAYMFFKKKEATVFIGKAYVASEGNIIFYSKFNIDIKTKPYTIEADPSTNDKVIQEFLKLRETYHN